MCLRKTGACLIQVYFNASAFLGNENIACLIQVACLIEVVAKTGFIVYFLLLILLEQQNILRNWNECLRFIALVIWTSFLA